MRWCTRIITMFLGLILMAALYLTVRHRREANSASSFHPDSVVQNRRNPSRPLDVDRAPQQRNSILGTIPFAEANPNSEDLSSLSDEERTVLAARQRMADGEFQSARDLLRTALSATLRGHNYLNYGRPDRINVEGQYETWGYYKKDQAGVLRDSSEFGFVIKPSEGQAGNLNPAHPNAGASAFWAFAYSFYKEGGLENIQKTKDIFQDFLMLFPNGPEDLVQAAQIDIAVIDIELIAILTRSRAQNSCRDGGCKGARNIPCEVAQ